MTSSSSKGDRPSGAALEPDRYVVDGTHLADAESGESIVSSQDSADIPRSPSSSSRPASAKRGGDQPWILDRDLLLSKATITVEGDLDDPCKYPLLFVTATRT